MGFYYISKLWSICPLKLVGLGNKTVTWLIPGCMPGYTITMPVKRMSLVSPSTSFDWQCVHWHTTWKKSYITYITTPSTSSRESNPIMSWRLHQYFIHYKVIIFWWKSILLLNEISLIDSTFWTNSCLQTGLRLLNSKQSWTYNIHNIMK